MPTDALLNLPLHAVPLVVLDLETTGLHPYGDDRICEVALHRTIGGVTEATLDMLIDPQRPLSAHACRVTGIRPEHLVGAPRFAEVADRLLDLLAGAALVAHNAAFDTGFLHCELARLGRPPLGNPVIDTLALARRLLPARHSYSLAALAAALGVRPPLHRAMADVLVLRAVFDDLAARLAAQGITTLGETLRYARGFRPGEPEPALPAPITAALREGHPLRIVYASLSSREPIERIIRPLEVINERGVLYVRAYCYLRNDLRAFAIPKIVQLELLEHV
jgi:DNA polymerase-3 subunit epsilon